MSDHSNSTPVAESAAGDGQLPDVAAEGGDSDNDNAGRARPKQTREKADPTLVPKSGSHWQHDMRGVADASSSRGGGKGRNLFDAGERGGRPSGKADGKWTHDKFESSPLSGISPPPALAPPALAPFRVVRLLLRPPLNLLQKLDLSPPMEKAATPPLPPALSLQQQLPALTCQPPPSARLALSRVLAADPSQLSPRRPPPPASQTPPPSAPRMKVGAARDGLPPPLAVRATASHPAPAAPRARTVKGRDVSRAAATAAGSGSRGRGGAAASSDRSANVTSGAAASARALVAGTALNVSAAAAHDLPSTAVRGRGGSGSAGRGRDDRLSAQRVSEHTYSAGADDGSS